jgi:hypothetical protein
VGNFFGILVMSGSAGPVARLSGFDVKEGVGKCVVVSTVIVAGIVLAIPQTAIDSINKYINKK